MDQNVVHPESLGQEGAPSPKPLNMNMYLCTDIFSDEESLFRKTIHYAAGPVQS